MIKIDFSDSQDHSKFLDNGFFSNSLFFPAESFLKLKSPILCFKCQHFGHKSEFCQASKAICSKCSGNHSFKECSSTELRCFNCKGSHSSPDKKCPAYLSNLNKLNAHFLQIEIIVVYLLMSFSSMMILILNQLLIEEVYILVF